MRFSVYVAWPSVLSLNNLKVLKIHKTKTVKNIGIQEKCIFRLTFITGAPLLDTFKYFHKHALASLSCLTLLNYISVNYFMVT